MSDKLKYDVGDKVILLPRELAKNIGEEFDWRLGCNRCVKILGKVNENSYHVRVADGNTKRGNTRYGNTRYGNTRYVITDADILGYAFMYNEEIEVRDSDGEEWRTESFKYYKAGSEFPFNTTGVYWRQSRPIRKPIIEVTVKVNGKEVDASVVPEDTWAELRGAK